MQTALPGETGHRAPRVATGTAAVGPTREQALERPGQASRPFPATDTHLCPRQAELHHIVKIIEFLILLPLLSPHTFQVTVIIGGGDLANLHDGLLHLYAHGWRHFEQALDQRVGRLVVSPRVDQQPVVQWLHTDQRCPPRLLRPVCKLGVVIKLEESQSPSCVRSHEKPSVVSKAPTDVGDLGGPADTGAAVTGRVPLEGHRDKVCAEEDSTHVHSGHPSACWHQGPRVL